MDQSYLPKISADAHVDEPHDLWYSRLPEGLREAAPHHIQARPDGGWRMVVNGADAGLGSRKERVRVTGRQRVDQDRDDEITLQARFQMMRVDEVNGEIIFPTIGLYAYQVEDPEVGLACCELYNEWIYERLSGSPRVKLAMLVPTWSVPAAIHEIERWAPNDTVGGLFLPLVGTPEWNDPQWEPMWDAIEQSGKPVVMHQSTGHTHWYNGVGAPLANLMYMQTMAPRVCALLAGAGVLQRHPNLHFVLVEVNAGWLAAAMSSLDAWAPSLAPNFGSNMPELAEKPSWYVRRQIHATFMNDDVAIKNRDYTGLDCLMWGNDFPHMEGTYPNSSAILNELFQGVDEQDVRQIAVDNALRLFGFQEAILTSLPD
jgi:predicted TIM-barrel fold metal-dependent hydrolase